MAKIIVNNQVLTCTDDIAAAREDLSLISFDRAQALVTGGKASWLEPPEQPAPEAPANEPAPAGSAATHDVTLDTAPVDPPPGQQAEPAEDAAPAPHTEPAPHA